MPATITDIRPGVRDLFERMAGGKMYEEAEKRGVTMSALLEEADPSEDYNRNENPNGLTAFDRQLRLAGIRTKSDPAAGVYAHTFEAFAQNDNAWALAPEWVATQWRKVKFASRQERFLMLSDAEAPGGVMAPYVDAAQARVAELTAPLALSELVAQTTSITGDVYRAFYLTAPTAAQKSLVRVAEAAEIPRWTMTGGDHTVNLTKKAKALEASYEALRRQQIDKFALQIALMAIQAETDKVAAALLILVNGDGNASTAATNYNLTTLDPAAVAGTLTLKGWLAFKDTFESPYSLTSALATSATALQMRLLNIGSANVPLYAVQQAAGFGSFVQMNQLLADAVRLGVTAGAPALTIVGFDRRFALEHVVESGADITEAQRWSLKQTQTLTMSETDGWASLIPGTVKTLTISA